MSLNNFLSKMKVINFGSQKKKDTVYILKQRGHQNFLKINCADLKTFHYMLSNEKVYLFKSAHFRLTFLGFSVQGVPKNVHLQEGNSACKQTFFWGTPGS